MGLTGFQNRFETVLFEAHPVGFGAHGFGVWVQGIQVRALGFRA